MTMLALSAINAIIINSVACYMVYKRMKELD